MLALVFWTHPEVVASSWVELASSISLLGLLTAGYRKINCHEPGCWRIGKHHVEGTPYVTCHEHHPGLEGNSIQPGHIQLAHRRKHGRP